MNKVIQNGLEFGGNGLMYFFTFTQTKEIFEYISLVLSIIISILIIVSRIISWYKNAKQDGKIDEDELKDGINIVVGGIEDIKENIDSHTKDKEGEQE